jgi:hypothetical protein
MTTLWIESDTEFIASSSLETTRQAGEEIGPEAQIATCPVIACAEFQLVPYRQGTRVRHALMAAALAAIRVNGSPVIGGLRVLNDQDEIRIGSQRMFFSAESTPVVEIYQQQTSGRRPRCPVCRAEIQDGQSVVRCPGCSRFHHQIDATDAAAAKPCWTYAPTCRFCEHPTSMSGEPTWRPDPDQLEKPDPDAMVGPMQ